MNARKQAEKQRYMAEFERCVIQHRPDLSGKIDWDEALHFFYTNVQAEEAARTYLIHRGQLKK